MLGQDVPDGLGELAGDVDAGDLGSALAPEALLVALVARFDQLLGIGLGIVGLLLLILGPWIAEVWLKRSR